MVTIRTLAAEETRAAADVFLGALHLRPLTDEDWRHLRSQSFPNRTFGAFDDAGELIGTATSLPAALRIPGGAELSMAAVTSVGVRADATRRGVLTDLMRAQLDACAAGGEPLAGLHASEPGIYGRFGYGVATRQVTVGVDTTKAGARNPRTVRFVPDSERGERLAALYDRIADYRPGTMRRPPEWWPGMLHWMGRDTPLTAVTHRRADGTEDGYALYTVDNTGTLSVHELRAAAESSAVELWRFLASVDLVSTVTASGRAADEPVAAYFPGTRAARITDSADDLWLRLVDVPAALAARTYGDGDVVVEVVDAFRPANSGNYRIGADGARRVSDEAGVRCDVAELASLYLGDRSPSTLAAAGRIEGDPAAIREADRVFATGEPIPWCGTRF